MDECFELLTLMQTGKSAIVPVVLVETGPKPFWRIWDRFVQGILVDRRLIDVGDTAFYRIVDTADDAVREITSFYRVFQSSRIVGDDLVFRLTRALTADEIRGIEQEFEDILKGPLDQSPGPVPQELNESPDLPRLIIPFNRSMYSRLRSSSTTSTTSAAPRSARPPRSSRASRQHSTPPPRTDSSTAVEIGEFERGLPGPSGRVPSECYSGSGRSWVSWHSVQTQVRITIFV